MYLAQSSLTVLRPTFIFIKIFIKIVYHIMSCGIKLCFPRCVYPDPVVRYLGGYHGRQTLPVVAGHVGYKNGMDL